MTMSCRTRTWQRSKQWWTRRISDGATDCGEARDELRTMAVEGAHAWVRSLFCGSGVAQHCGGGPGWRVEDVARLATLGGKFAKKDAKKIAKSNKKVKAEREL